MSPRLVRIDVSAADNPRNRRARQNGVLDTERGRRPPRALIRHKSDAAVWGGHGLARPWVAMTFALALGSAPLLPLSSSPGFRSAIIR